MTDFILRPTIKEDLSQIVKVWKSAFGDEENFILSLIEDCDLLENGVCAELDGEGRSFMFAFDGLKFMGKNASYIYALCTEPSYRGKSLGRSVTLYAAEMAAKRGSDIVFLKPANESLENWYASILGALPFARYDVEKIPSPAPSNAEVETLSPDEYLRNRSGCPWHLSRSLIHGQSCILRHYGGGFFRIGENYLCAEKMEHGVLIRELIGPKPDEALGAMAGRFPGQEFYILSPSSGGSSLMAIPPFLPPSKEASFVPFLLD